MPRTSALLDADSRRPALRVGEQAVSLTHPGTVSLDTNEISPIGLGWERPPPSHHRLQPSTTDSHLPKRAYRSSEDR